MKLDLGKKLGFGCMRLPVVNGETTNIDDVQFSKMIDTFLAQGFRYFDTAYPYHNEQSEAAVRRCLVERYDRDAFYLADKMPVWLVKETADFERIFATQQERCGVEYFDFYLLHALNAERIAELEQNGGFDFLKELKASGRAKHIGFSFHDSAAVLEKTLAAHPEVDFVQLQINYYDWDSKEVQSGLCYEVATRHGVPVIVMEPIKGGTLANLAPKAAEILQKQNPDVTLASYAVRYAASLDNVMMVLSGMSNLSQLEDNTSYMKDFAPLTMQEKKAIEQVVVELHKLPTIACTGCRYCVAGCPKQILIPDLFGAYNKTVQFGNNDVTRRSYVQAVGDNHGKPSDCIRCGKCEGQCPQHLPIRELLTDVAKTFE